ncbi:nucleotidyltransferase domain-containing protein [Bordetella sp. BOR01]|uniref:nucleotidyltransferase domain-containing protein n=1 Tax=Bordetella sp. BOR01 TaxID=2854779 RepID=UPI001C489E76|nr:nucleotidyltransferase domain-containing protein [Bordetella sp. BOR01]MBV7481774.1 nucleotidyltransferase domain-containing protein [Bordetella sp. BOR01]
MIKPTRTQALNIIRTVIASRYQDAAYAFVAGSIMRGEGTYLSDIDVVIVYDRIDAAWREAFMADGVPVETFVHDPHTLAWFVKDDVARGRPSLLNMIAEGVVIGDTRRARTLQQDIARQLAQGPPAMALAQLDSLRYEITDAIDDLRGERSASEIMAIGAMLHPRLVELSLRGRGRWTGTGKWVPRLLAAVDGDLAARYDQAFGALFTSGACHAVIALAEGELASYGGPLFDGDRRVAPASSRI